MDTKQIWIGLGTIIAIGIPYFIKDNYESFPYLLYYVILGAVAVFLVYRFNIWDIKDFFTKKDKEPKKLINSLEVIKMLQELSLNPMYGKVGQIEVKNVSEISAGKENYETPFIAVQGQCFWKRQYRTITVNTFEPESFDLSEWRDEPYSKEEIKIIAGDMVKRREKTPERKITTEIDTNTGIRTTELTEKNLPTLPPKDEGEDIIK